MENNSTTTPVETQPQTLAAKVAEEKGTDTKEVAPSTMAAAKTFPVRLITGALTIFSVILSLPLLFMFIWLLVTGTHDCESILKLRKLQMGIAGGVFILFAASNIVVFLRSKLRTLGLFLVMVPSILMLTVGLGLVGAFNIETRTMPGSPRWLTVKVRDDNNWDQIKSCIYDTTSCKNLASKAYLLKSYDFTSTKLSPVESGCCVPPVSCEMEYVNATFWKKGEREVDSSVPYDEDCDIWRNGETALCYDCHACREGFLRPLKSKWKKIGIFLVVMSAVLILVHLILFVATMLEQFVG